MSNRSDDLVGNAAEGVAKGLIEGLGNFLESLQKLITGHLARKEQESKQKAEVLAEHIDEFANLVAISAVRLEAELDVSQECGRLHQIAEDLGSVNEKLKNVAHKAADVELAEAALSGKPSKTRKTTVAQLRELAGQIQGLAQELRRAYHLNPREYRQ